LATSAKDWFALQTDKYSRFDDEGVPSHDHKGFELSKEIKNKMKKDFNKHEETHKKWLEKQGKEEIKEETQDK
jgi:cysteinyl-tRNA synthetase